MLYCSCVDAFAYLFNTNDELILLHSIKILLLYLWLLILLLDAFIFYTFEILNSSEQFSEDIQHDLTYNLREGYDPEVLS